DEGACQVHLDDAPEFIDAGLRQRLVGADACTVHDPGDPTPRGDCDDGLFHSGLVGHVEGEGGVDRQAKLAAGLDQRLAPKVYEVRAPATLIKDAGGLEADAAGTAGDDDRAAHAADSSSPRRSSSSRISFLAILP